MNFPRTLLAASLLMMSLAGCAEEAPTEEGGGEFDDLDLQAGEDTGLIRGVVVDAAVVPVQGATVTLDGPGGPTATTNAAGAFGFSDVEPGIHQLLVDRTGYVATQTSVDVKAGVEQPPVVKVLLEHDANELPYVQAFHFQGYIECSVTSPAYRVAVCSLPGLSSVTDDEFLAVYEIQQDPRWVQAEMVWESTQALGDHMLLNVEVSAARETTVKEGNGTSPLVVTGYREDIERSGMATSGIMQQRVFNFQKPETTPPVPVCGIPDPINGGSYCARGVGATVSQSFEVFTHVAYRFQPADGWQFTVDGAPTVPPS